MIQPLLFLIFGMSPMATNIQNSQATGTNALALAATQYADAKNRADGTSQVAWQKIIYNLIASKQHTLV